MLAGWPAADASPDPLIVQARETVAREYGRLAPAPRADRDLARRLSDGAIRDLLARAGLRVDEVRELRWEQSLEERYAWLQVPVFAGNLRHMLGGLPYPQCMTLLADAYRHVAVARPEPRAAVTVAFAATAQHAGF